MADVGRYNAWFSDQRKGTSQIAMSMHLSFVENTFNGLGKDKFGIFAVTSGRIHGSEISFMKNYSTHVVIHKAKLSSMKTPIKATGTWHLQSDQSIKGGWGMALQGSPTHGAAKHIKHVALPKPKQYTSSGQGWVHSILQWAPIPFVATSWDAGASLFYLCTGNTKAAKEQIGDPGIDLEWDATAILTGEDIEVAREVERGAVVAARRVERTAGQAVAKTVERRGTVEIHPALDTLDEVAAAREIRKEAEHAAGDGQINQAGRYSEVARNHALPGVTEANHVPAFSTTKGTLYDIGHGSLSTLSTEHALQQGLNRLIGTTGAAELPRDIRQAMRRYMLKKNLSSALQLQILADYAAHGAIERYEPGLQGLVRHLGKLVRTDGLPFLDPPQVSQMLKWLTNQVTRARDAPIIEYTDYVYDEIMRHMSKV